MDAIMLPVEFMKLGYIFIPAFVLFFALDIAIKNQFAKALLVLLKAFAYGGLAILMWKYYQGKEQIDIISAFTFIFCCFEAADNAVSFFAIPINIYRQSQERLQDKLDTLDIINKYRK